MGGSKVPHGVIYTAQLDHREYIAESGVYQFTTAAQRNGKFCNGMANYSDLKQLGMSMAILDVCQQHPLQFHTCTIQKWRTQHALR